MGRSIEERLQIIEDRDEIAKLKARYVNLNDGGWKGPTHTQPDAVAALFTPDGVWDGGASTGVARGTDEIRALFQQFQAVPFIVHYVANPLIEVSGDRATGHWHALVTMTMPGPQAIWTLGLYIDDFVRTEEGWKIETLRFETAATTRYELGWAKEQFAYQSNAFES